MSSPFASIDLPTTEARQKILACYTKRTPASCSAHKRALTLLPGGVNRQIVYHPPYPLFLRHGQGAYVEDLDCNRFLDMLGNYTAMILGHCHPAIVAAAETQLRQGTGWAAASPLEAELAALIAARLPSIEQIRFTSSGTEAAMMAIRAARAHTGRPLIAKFEGAYHGLYDEVMVSVTPPLGDAGDSGRPAACVPFGVPRSVRETVLVLPFNQLDHVEAIVANNAQRLAAVLVEPIMGVAGMISPAPRFLKSLRELTTRHGIVLVFDEVISFRIGFGGAQELFGIRPDLTILGKIIGGGFPVGAVGGSREVMRVFDPDTSPAVMFSGTFHANPVTMAAGIATLTQLTTSAIEQLNGRGEQLRTRIQSVLGKARYPTQVTGLASLFNFHLTSEPITDYRSSARGDKRLMEWLYLALLNEGVIVAPRGMGCLSVPMTSDDINLFGEALARAMLTVGLVCD